MEKGLFVMYMPSGEIDTNCVHQCELLKEESGSVTCKCNQKFDDFYSDDKVILDGVVNG